VGTGTLWGFVNLVGLGIAAILFTYDGWIDVTHVSGEVRNPQRNLPMGLIAGVIAIIILYLLANYAYMRVLSLEEMRKSGDLIAARVSSEIFGAAGSRFLTLLITISSVGALGGLVMTVPRLFFAAASTYDQQLSHHHPVHWYFSALSRIYSQTAVPIGSILFSAAISILALLFFQSISRIITFLVVPLQSINILMVASIFRLRKRMPVTTGYRTPGYPWTPLLFIVVIALFLISSILYKPGDTLIGILLTATGAPVYLWMKRDLHSAGTGEEQLV
jgi:amino acid transporter